MDKITEQIIGGRAKKEKDGPFTYRELYRQLAEMTDAQLDQRVQIMPNNPTPAPTLLQPVYGIDTIENYCHVNGEVATETRSIIDFEHHPEHVVLLADDAPFDEDGNSFFTMEDGGMRGNKTGKLYPL